VDVYAGSVEKLVEDIMIRCNKCNTDLSSYLPGTDRCDECCDRHGDTIELVHVYKQYTGSVVVHRVELWHVDKSYEVKIYSNGAYTGTPHSNIQDALASFHYEVDAAIECCVNNTCSSERHNK